jgi:DNA-binding winged helix-turn-helix (wHTH) protein
MTKKSQSSSSLSQIQSWLQLGQLRFEKCEIKESQIAFTMALTQAKKAGDLRATMEALSGVLRLSAESLDEPAMDKWSAELQELMKAHPEEIPAMAWYCKAVVARHQRQVVKAQRFAHEYIHAIEKDQKEGYESFGIGYEEALVRGWTLVATILFTRGKVRRAQWLSGHLFKMLEANPYRGVAGVLYIMLAHISERQRNYDSAMELYRKSHASFLSEHNWYFHLYALLGYARVHRLQQSYSQAHWYLDLIDKAAPTAEFGALRREVAIERAKLEQDAVDLLIDSRKGVVKTREAGQISLRKQYVLLHILEALSKAHSIEGEDFDRGLSKAEIIEKVWEEPYRPEAHDNKLYYNINRLRKLIEPDIRKPQYLLNWKEGYRLAPGLRVQFIGGLQKFKGGEV